MLSNHKPVERKGKVLLINASDMHSSMRKSLGSKRKFLDDDAIRTIVELYSRYEQSPIAKIFNTTDFGYRRITVERPMKLAIYPHDAEKLSSLSEQKAWERLDDELKQAILTALAALPEDKYLCREVFKKAFNKAFAASSTSKLPATVLKLLLSNIGEQDEAAEVCKTKGEPEPATELRDYENVPLSEDIYTYFKREVLPHVADAWIDTSKTDPLDEQVGVVGYEIPFNRHFYQYQPPRSLAEIDAELDDVSKDIMKLLAEVHS